MAGKPGGGPTASARMFKRAITAKIHEPIKRGSPRTHMDAIANALIKKAKEGDVAALREVMDRVDGKVPQGVDLEAVFQVVIKGDDADI